MLTIDLEDFYRLLQDVCVSAADLLHAGACSIYLKKGHKVVLRAASGYSTSLLIHKAEYDLNEGITGWVATDNEVLLNSREDIDSHHHHKGKYDHIIWKDIDGVHKCSSLLAIPLKIGDFIYGLIKVENKHSGASCAGFTSDDLRLLNIFVASISNILQENKQLWSALDRYFVFVLMPFNDKFANIYDTISQAAQQLDMHCEKVDTELTIGRISTKIFEMIERADIVVSVMTDKNPNVFYETGYSHAKGKPTIPMAEDAQAIPFDLQDFRHIIYSPDKLADLRSVLKDYFHIIRTSTQMISKQIGP